MRQFLWIVLLFLTTPSWGQEIGTDTSKIYETSIRELLSYHKTVTDSLTRQLELIEKARRSFPYWDLGGNVLGGVNFTSFSNWANRGEDYDATSSNIALGIAGYSRRIGKDFFWRNRGKLKLGWQKTNSLESQSDGFINTTDLLKLETHYGQNIIEELAFSVLGEWDSRVFDRKLSPSYLDLSLGLTWTPEENFIAIFHPLNYELVITDIEGYTSSSGAKVVVDYREELSSELQLAIDLSGFLSYKDLSLLSNFTSTVGLNMKFFKNIGFGFEYALRINKQETIQIGNGEEHVQSYVVMGLTYKIP